MNPERLLQHFDRISEAPDTVARSWRFILDLAVWGKPVLQSGRDFELQSHPRAAALREHWNKLD